MKVLVTGGTGYVGQPIVASLLAHGHDVVVVQRAGSTRGMRTKHPQLTVREVPLLDEPGMIAATMGMDAVVNLVGIIRETPRHGLTMQRLHVNATQVVVKAAQQAGVTRFIQMSALGARPDAVSRYHQSKWQGEEVVRASGIPAAILRPSVIFGAGGPGPNFVSQLTNLVVHAPLCPVIGDGQFMLQPVALQTIVDAVIVALRATTPVTGSYEVGGGDVISYRAILQRIADAHGKSLRTVRIPLRLMTWLASALSHVKSFPITEDQLIMLREGNVCNDTETFYRTFALTPQPFVVTVAQHES